MKIHFVLTSNFIIIFEEKRVNVLFFDFIYLLNFRIYELSQEYILKCKIDKGVHPSQSLETFCLKIIL